MERTLVIVVSGRVQGVAFRMYTREKATELQIRGSVQNQSDGTVKIIAQGIDYELKSLKDWASTGSPASRVDNVHCEICMMDSFTDFKIIR